MPLSFTPGIASMVLREHQKNTLVGDSVFFKPGVDCHGVASVSIVKIKFRGAQDDVKVVSVGFVEMGVSARLQTKQKYEKYHFYF